MRLRHTALDDIAIKLDRAEEHLHTLDAEISRFATEQPYAFHVVTYKGSDKVRDFLWLREPPRRWSALVGDCVHNLRCALDHIVWTLSGGDGTAPNHAEFPIFQDERKYFERTNQGKPKRGSGLSKIEGVNPLAARARIDALQPFTTPHAARHPLWVLHELDRFDKHRALHVIGGWAYTAGIDGHRIRSTRDIPPGWRRIKATSSPELPTPMLAGQKTRVKVRSDLAMRVTLESEVVRHDENVDVLLSALIDFVRREVVDSFRPWL